MPFVAEAMRTCEQPPEEVFDRLADGGSWSAWMPRSFRPVKMPTAPLRAGDRLRVRIVGGPSSTLEVVLSERPRELTWIGGVRGVLFAEHRFLFEPQGDGGTLVRSIETWSGSLAALLRPLIQPIAQRVGRAQLEGLSGQRPARRAEP
jgi:hypothetical protein